MYRPGAMSKYRIRPGRDPPDMLQPFEDLKHCPQTDKKNSLQVIVSAG